ELMDLSHIKLAGDHVRHNAYLVERAIERLGGETAFVSEDSAFSDSSTLVSPGPEEANAAPALAIIDAISSFPGTARRMEKLADNLYSDYGHHPVEIAATLQLARELSDHVVLVYQPHQNVRQHEVKDDYTACMELAEEVYWLPTYLSREDPDLEVLTPEQLSQNLTNRDKVHLADLNDELWSAIKKARDDGKLVLCMGAGSIDGWLRQQLAR
ncbi:MAG TPA: cyanophycin synthetase, partial [Candidatus Saccharimonadales bacterium]|nr:cyanophycin synthetase [Candidatus Saccharimonadales bacterium]